MSFPSDFGVAMMNPSQLERWSTGRLSSARYRGGVSAFSPVNIKDTFAVVPRKIKYAILMTLVEALFIKHIRICMDVWIELTFIFFPFDVCFILEKKTLTLLIELNLYTLYISYFGGFILKTPFFYI